MHASQAFYQWCGRIICILSIMYFNKMLIGQAGSIGGKTRQEVEVEQREREYSRKQEAPSPVLPRPLERKDVSCPAGKGTEPCG